MLHSPKPTNFSSIYYFFITDKMLQPDEMASRVGFGQNGRQKAFI